MRLENIKVGDVVRLKHREPANNSAILNRVLGCTNVWPLSELEVVQTAKEA